MAERDVASVTVRTGPLTFTIDTGAGGRPDQRSQLTLDRRTGDVVRWEPFSTFNAGRRLRAWFRFVHTGEAGGIAGQTIAGMASTGSMVMVWRPLSRLPPPLSGQSRSIPGAPPTSYAATAIPEDSDDPVTA